MTPNLPALEGQILAALYPQLSKPLLRRLLHLCREKGVALVPAGETRNTLDRLLGSVICHNSTHYDQLCPQVGRDRARGIIAPVVAREVRRAKGVVA